MAFNRTNYIPIAQESLGISSIDRGIGGLNSPVLPGSNGLLDGATNAGATNVQAYSNQRLAEQNMLQNIGSAAPQAAANAMGQVRKETAVLSDQEVKAQQFATERMSEALYANQSGTALMKINALMQSPEKAKFMNDIAMGKALAEGMNPDLGAEVASARQYG
jgi:hypothetical protein